MKKTYIKPETTVVALKVKEQLLSGSEQVNLSNTDYDGSAKIEAREVIKTQDAWEEW
jgi:hypothetical protein